MPLYPTTFSRATATLPLIAFIHALVDWTKQRYG
jgi:hypothetical protein